MSLHYIIRKCSGGYKFTKSQEKTNSLMYMDVNKGICHKWKRTEDRGTNNKNIQPEYRNASLHWKMCYVYCEKEEKRNNRRNWSAKASELLERTKISWNIGSKLHKKQRWKKINCTSEEHENCSKSSLSNTWTVLLVRYSRPFLKWTREELGQMDQRTRELITIYKALYLRENVEGLYVSLFGFMAYQSLLVI